MDCFQLWCYINLLLHCLNVIAVTEVLYTVGYNIFISLAFACILFRKSSIFVDVFVFQFAEAIVNDIKPVEFRQEFIPEFKVWLDYALQGDNPVDGLFVVLSRLGKNCGVCSRVEPFPNFLKLLRKHVVT